MNVDAILDALRAEVPVEIYRRNEYELLRATQRGSCVQATRMGIEALKYFGVQAKPLITLMMTGNAAWEKWMTEGGPTKGLPFPDDVWSVGTDPDMRGRGYPAHLVIEIDGFLLDLDSGFASRPEKNLHVPPTILLPLLEGKGEEGDVIAINGLTEGGVVLYRAHTPKVNYKESGAWRDSQKWAGPVIRRMRDRLRVTIRHTFAEPDDPMFDSDFVITSPITGERDA